MSYCANCGKELREGAKFCTNCGTPTEIGIRTQTQTQPQTQSHPQAPASSGAGIKMEPETKGYAGSGIRMHPETKGYAGAGRMSQEERIPSGRSSGKKTAIIIAIIAAIVAVGVLTAVFLLKGGPSNNEKNEPVTAAEDEEKRTFEETEEAKEGKEAEKTDAETDPAETDASDHEEKSGEPAETAEAAKETQNEDSAASGAITVQDYAGSWVGSDRWGYTVEVDGPDTVRVHYQGSNGANSGITAEGTGYLQNNELILNMVYTDYRYDAKGQAAYRDHAVCTDRVSLVSSLSDRYVLNSNDFILKKEDGFGSAALYNAYEQNLADCKEKENYAVWSKGDSLDDEYIIWYSSDILLSEGDISWMDETSLRLARNEIYARHGRKFTSDDLRQHFENCSWYHGSVEADRFNDNVLSQTEKTNVKLIEKLEDASAAAKKPAAPEPLKNLVKSDIYEWWKADTYYNASLEHNTYSDAFSLGDWAGSVIQYPDADMITISRNVGNRNEWLFGTDTGNNLSNNFRYYYAYYYSLKDYYNSNGKNCRDVYDNLRKEILWWYGADKGADVLIQNLYNDLQPMITAANDCVRRKRR